MAIVEQKKENKNSKKASKKNVEPIVAAENAELACRFLVEPWITEKSHSAMANGKYTFRVSGQATKKEVKAAVSGIYKVKVEKVNVVNLKPKYRSYGRHGGRKSAIRKAIVTLKEGDKIELFKA